MGCVHLYCGDGKGKTTAAIGLAVRAAGAGKQVVAARFLKTDQSGEVEILKRLPEVTLIPCEKTFGFTWKSPEEREAQTSSNTSRTSQVSLFCIFLLLESSIFPHRFTASQHAVSNILL